MITITIFNFVVNVLSLLSKYAQKAYSIIKMIRPITIYNTISAIDISVDGVFVTETNEENKNPIVTISSSLGKEQIARLITRLLTFWLISNFNRNIKKARNVVIILTSNYITSVYLSAIKYSP